MAFNNKDVLSDDFFTKTSGLAQSQEQALHWHEGKQGKPETNTCVNDNKATGNLEYCHTVGNSAWNTHSSAVTGKPADALKAPYPAWSDWPNKKEGHLKDYK